MQAGSSVCAGTQPAVRPRALTASDGCYGSAQATKKLCVCLMDEALERMEANGEGTETVLVIFDLRGFGYVHRRAYIDSSTFALSQRGAP